MKKIFYGAIAGVALLLATTPVFADNFSINFETPTYSVSNINGQDGWSKTGPYDSAVVSNTYGFSTFDAQSLRISNAVTTGSFGDQTFSKSLANEAGETDAQASGYSGGIRQPHFEAQFDIASTMSTEQSGLKLSLSPDRGDGARMSYLRFDDMSDGIHVYFDDYQDVLPYGSLATPADGCGTGDDWVESQVAVLSRTMPHTIKLTMDFVDGPRNDVVKVYIDGNLVKTGTSWEDYFRWCTESGGGVVNGTTQDVSRTVDSILFRAGGAAASGTLGKGYLFDNLTLKSYTENISSPTIFWPPNNIDITSGDLRGIYWSSVTGTYTPITYQYDAYTNPEYTSHIYTSGWMSDSFIPTPGTPNGNYYIRVRAQDSKGDTSDWSNGPSNPYKITVGPATALSLPNDKDQCKKDKWETSGFYPTFSNQGSCVSFVQSIWPVITLYH